MTLKTQSHMCVHWKSTLRERRFDTGRITNCNDTDV